MGLTPFEIEGRAYGGLVGSIEDLVALGRALITPGVLLERETLDAMATRTARGPRGEHGLGFWFHADGWIGHGGEAGGYRAELHVAPTRDRGVAVLVNAGDAPSGEIVEALKPRRAR